METAQVFVDLTVPEDAEGLYRIRTLGLWRTNLPTNHVDEVEHLLRVQRPPTDTFDRWEAPSWGTSTAHARSTSP